MNHTETLSELFDRAQLNIATCIAVCVLGLLLAMGIFAWGAWVGRSDQHAAQMQHEERTLIMRERALRECDESAATALQIVRTGEVLCIHGPYNELR